MLKSYANVRTHALIHVVVSFEQKMWPYLLLEGIRFIRSTLGLYCDRGQNQQVPWFCERDAIGGTIRVIINAVLLPC